MPIPSRDRFTGFPRDRLGGDRPMGRRRRAGQDPDAPGLVRGVVLYDRVAKLGGLAHIVLPSARGAVDHPGKYADTAIPALIADLDRRLGGKAQSRLIAKLAGGASMFQLDPGAR